MNIETIRIAEKIQDIELVSYKDNYGVFKDSTGYFFANFSDNYIVNLKTVIKGSKDNIFDLFKYYSKTGKIDAKIVSKKFKIVKKVKKCKKILYTPFIISNKNIEELMEF